jgi:Ran GTPase-activating protein (RanGAP) involved in mRNA processing and transport
LDLSHNSLGYEGGKSIAQFLAINMTLRQLNLSNNGLDDRVASHIAKSIESRKVGVLTTLNLSHNKFGERGGVILVI